MFTTDGLAPGAVFTLSEPILGVDCETFVVQHCCVLSMCRYLNRLECGFDMEVYMHLVRYTKSKEGK